MSVSNYRELLVWQKAMDLVEHSYRVVSTFPVEERFALSSQIRRAVVSVAANIAEGQGRHSIKEFLNHLSMARGSLMEWETLMLVSQRVGYLPEAEVARLLQVSDEVSRMLSGLRRALEAKLK